MSGSRDGSTEAALDLREKGVPGLREPVALSAVTAQDWWILREDLPLPLAVIKDPPALGRASVQDEPLRRP